MAVRQLVAHVEAFLVRGVGVAQPAVVILRPQPLLDQLAVGALAAVGVAGIALVVEVVPAVALYAVAILCAIFRRLHQRAVRAWAGKCYAGLYRLVLWRPEVVAGATAFAVAVVLAVDGGSQNTVWTGASPRHARFGCVLPFVRCITRTTVVVLGALRLRGKRAVVARALKWSARAGLSLGTLVEQLVSAVAFGALVLHCAA